MRMASLLLSVPVLIQAVMPEAAWWRKYFRKALASADSGLAAAGLAVAGLAVSWLAATGLAVTCVAAAGVAEWDENAVVVAIVPSMAAAMAEVSTNRFTPALAWILRFLCCMTAPAVVPFPMTSESGPAVVGRLRERVQAGGSANQPVARA